MNVATPPIVTLDHWQTYRVTAGDTIERWDVVNATGGSILTCESEIAARDACRQCGWMVSVTNESGWINLPPEAS